MENLLYIKIYVVQQHGYTEVQSYLLYYKKNRVTGTRYLLHQQSISNITILNMKKTSILLRKLFKFMLFHALSNEKINASVKIEFLLKV